jgi:hypothetical protein
MHKSFAAWLFGLAVLSFPLQTSLLAEEASHPPAKAPAAQSKEAPESQSATPEAEVPGPDFGSFMILTQIRHLKLWIAGQAQNWDLADYEVGELMETFEDAPKIFPKYRGIEVGPMLEKVLDPPLKAVELAVRSHSMTNFVAAYDQLTAGCNNCHQAAKRAFIVVQRPAAGAQLFPNQLFTPQHK